MRKNSNFLQAKTKEMHLMNRKKYAKGDERKN